MKADKGDKNRNQRIRGIPLNVDAEWTITIKAYPDPNTIENSKNEFLMRCFKSIMKTPF